MTIPIEFRTRSDYPSGKYPFTNYFDKLIEAIEAYDDDNHINCISYTHKSKDYRWIPKRKIDTWGKFAEEKLKQLSQKYLLADSNEIFWIEKSLLPEGYFALINIFKHWYIPNELWYLYIEPYCINQILSDKQFRDLAKNNIFYS